MSIENLPHDASIGPSLRAWLERARQELSRPRRPIYIPVTQFSGHLSDVSLGNGTPALENINSLGLVGLRIDAVDDDIHHIFFVPKNFNVDTNIRIAVVWCTNSTDTAETATWVVEYSTKEAGEALAVAGTALDKTIEADAVLGSYVIAESPYGEIAGGNLYHGDYVHLKVSLGAVSGLNPAADIVFLLGILITDE